VRRSSVVSNNNDISIIGKNRLQQIDNRLWKKSVFTSLLERQLLTVTSFPFLHIRLASETNQSWTDCVPTTVNNKHQRHGYSRQINKIDRNVD